jgi:hypothetical protein
LRSIAQDLAQRQLQFVKQMVDALLQTLVLQHQGVAHHDAAQAGVFLGKLQDHGHHVRGFFCCTAFALVDLLNQTKHAVLNEIDQALKHLRLAGKVAVQRCFADLQLRGQRGGGDALCARLLQHGGQGLQDLLTPFAGLHALAFGCGFSG